MDHLPEENRAALEQWVTNRLGMSIDEVLTFLAMLNGAQMIDDVPPATMAYWTAFFHELNRRTLIYATGIRQLRNNR